MPRKAKESQPELFNSLLSALEFVSVVQPKRAKVPAYTHCRLFDKHLSACGPVLSASIDIQEDIECCPQTQKFLKALQQCPESVNLTLLPSKELSIKSGNFHAIVPCVDQMDIPAIFPDTKQQLKVELPFQQAIEKIGQIADEYSKLILYSSVVLLDGSVIATNGDIIFEAWHGCSSPHPVILPKLLVSALRRTKGKAVYLIGWSADSFTTFYPDGSWIKTHLQSDPAMPDLKGFLSLPAQFTPAPLGLWAAVERLAPFSGDGRIYFRANGVSTDRYETDGAINLCEGLPDGISFPIAALRIIAPFAEKLAFNVTEQMTYFQGDKVRGAITQREEKRNGIF